LYHTAFFASRRASVHLHFSGLPIDLWVVVLEPGITEDHVLPSEAGDSEEHSFGVGFITEDYVYHFRDLTCLVGGAIHIVHRYGVRDVPGINIFHLDEVSIYEVVCSSRVQKCLDGMHLTGVCGADFYWKDDRHPTSIEGIDKELFGQPLFLFWFPELRCPVQSRGSVSIGSQISVLTSSMSNTANLLTSSDWGTLFADHAKQNPPPRLNKLLLPLLHSLGPLNLQSIPLFAPWLTSRCPNGGGSPLQDSWPLHTNSNLAEVKSVFSGLCLCP